VLVRTSDKLREDKLYAKTNELKYCNVSQKPILLGTMMRS